MIVVDPDNHDKAIRIWKRDLGGKPNGGRILGSAVSKYLTNSFEPYYDMLVTYGADISFPIPDGVKRIAIIWHQNWPPESVSKTYQRVLENIGEGYFVDIFCNEPRVVKIINSLRGRAFYIPRFIDTTTLPSPQTNKTISTLWFGNRWGRFNEQFRKYCLNKEPYWISQGIFGKGDVELCDVSRKTALEIVNNSKKVWAIGLSQLEAQYLGAEIVAFRDEPLPFYNHETIVYEVDEILLNMYGKIRPDIPKIKK